jgi:hypothetical protein
MKPFRNKAKTADAPAPNQRCMGCVHFRNCPDYLEAEIPGLKTMGSGHASVRKDDGICTLLDLYLSADAWCEQFTARAEQRPA